MFSLKIGSEGTHDYAEHMLVPLYKVCEGFSGKVVSGEFIFIRIDFNFE